MFLYFVLLLYFLCYALQKYLMKIHSLNYYFVDIINSLHKISDIMPSFDYLHFCIFFGILTAILASLHHFLNNFSSGENFFVFLSKIMSFS